MVLSNPCTVTARFAKLALALTCCAMFLLLAGCSGTPPKTYVFSKTYKRYMIERQEFPGFDRDAPPIEQGEPVAIVDGLGHYLFSIPGKLLLLNARVGNHRFSNENRLLIHQYLLDNDLNRVKVRINQYAPGNEFMRLWQNSDVGLGYRATFGVGHWLVYTVLPGRLFAGIPGLGDGYNPYTNSVYIYSDHPALAIKEVARAKDYVQRRYKGTYAVLGIIPLVDTYQTHVATCDTVRYFYWLREKDLETGAYKVLWPAYGMDTGRALVTIGPIPALVYAGIAGGGSIIGNIAGRMQAPERREHEDPPPWQDLVPEPESESPPQTEPPQQP